MGRSDVAQLDISAAPASETEPVVAAPAPPAPLVHNGRCPYCQSKLSSIETKMERCMGCGASLSHSLRAAASAGPEHFIVRI
jgi:hypothetical protein